MMKSPKAPKVPKRPASMANTGPKLGEDYTKPMKVKTHKPKARSHY